MPRIKFLEDPNEPIELRPSGSMPSEWHVFEPHTIKAINAAIAARRPLLVTGDPGVGKSQLARAAAQQLGRAFISFVVDSRTESRDLLYHFEAVQRLADAQIYGHTRRNINVARKQLAESNYVKPGPFWWAYAWADAETRSAGFSSCQRERPPNWTPDDGCTVLIDEIDKGESDVPNGLLEVLGAREFTPLGTTTPVVIQGVPPLVVITTNAERILPDAFLRRCFVLSLDLPSNRSELMKKLAERGKAHFPYVAPRVIDAAAELLAIERELTLQTPRPGQAEFLDLIRAVSEIETETEAQIAQLDVLKQFAFQKRSSLGAV